MIIKSCQNMGGKVRCGRGGIEAYLITSQFQKNIFDNMELSVGRLNCERGRWGDYCKILQ